jgi:hypothetical protein
MNKILHANWIGEGVEEIRQIPGELHIIGDTSKGIFFRHSSKRVIFLSREKFCGPLSITLDQPYHMIVGDDARADISSERIKISQEFDIDFQSTRIWKPPAWDKCHDVRIDPLVIRALRLMSLNGNKNESLLNRLPLLEGDLNLSDSSEKSLVDRFQPILKDFGTASVKQQVSQLVRVIGFGRGLTPSGDDFLCGIVLGMVRYGLASPAIPGIDLLRADILPVAYEKTTLVSANILDFAFRGQTDERIIHGLDEILSINPSVSRLESSLMEWGNTSGLDTLAGLLVLLKAIGNL